MDNWIFLIPLLPFLGFLVNGLLGRRLGDRTVAIIGGIYLTKTRRADERRAAEPAVEQPEESA